MKTQVSDVLYCGCMDDSGHYLFRPDGSRVRYSAEGWQKAQPWGFAADGALYPRTEPNGVARLHHRDGWTALSFSDNTLDSRPGSHSTFLLKGILTFDEALAKSKAVFPDVFNRFTFEIRQEFT